MALFNVQSVKGKIKKLDKEMSELESKRMRSQASLVSALLKNTVPDEEDVEYFNNYSSKIDALRAEIRELKILLTVRS